MLSVNNTTKTQAGTLTGLAAKLQAKADSNKVAPNAVVPAVKPKDGDIDENSIEYVTAVYGTVWASGWKDAEDGIPARSTNVKYMAGYKSVSPAKVPISTKATNPEIEAIKASVSSPVRLTVPASPEAKSGVSLADQVAKQGQDMANLTAMMQALLAGGGQIQPTATVPTAQSVAPKATKPKGFAARKPISAPATSGNDDGEPRESFDAKTYFSLGDNIAQQDDTFIAESSDQRYSKNAIAIVGVQRKTIMLSEAKLLKLYKLMRQLDPIFDGE